MILFNNSFIITTNIATDILSFLLRLCKRNDHLRAIMIIYVQSFSFLFFSLCLIYCSIKDSDTVFIITEMHAYEILGQVIVEELIKVRKDFKFEIQRLGDRLEKCLSLQAASYKKANSYAHNVCSVEELQNTTFSKPKSDEYVDGYSSQLNQPANNLTSGNRECETVDTTVEIEVSNDLQESSFVYKDKMALIPKLEKTTGDPFPAIVEADPTNEHESSGEVDTSVDVNDLDASIGARFISKLSLTKHVKKNKENPSLLCSKPTQTPHSRSPYEKHLPRSTKKDKTINKKRMKTTFKCVVCEKINCDVHNQLTMQLDNRHHCIFCLRSYVRSSDLNRHMRAHTGETPYACEKCGKKFRRVDILKKHSKRCCWLLKKEEAVLVSR